MHEVYKTLIEAFILVFIVVLVFLQNWRATIIPMVAVPVSLIGTLAVMAMLGFSLNNLSLFGLVLAIGIVVDDAIVVVENVERNMALGMGPRDASRQAMIEVSGPVIAIALVLCAVFVPTAFIAGISGQFYRQFALTIAASTVISAFNSLTLSPALCAILLKAARPRTSMGMRTPGRGIAAPGHRHSRRRWSPYMLLTPVLAPLFGMAVAARRGRAGAAARAEPRPVGRAPGRVAHWMRRRVLRGRRDQCRAGRLLPGLQLALRSRASPHTARPSACCFGSR